MTTNILILAAGQVLPDKDEGAYPVCLTELDGVSVIERIVANTNNITDRKYTFALLNKEIENYYLDRVVSLLIPDSHIARISEGSKGSACTALLSACQLDRNEPLLIVSANELVDVDLSKVVNTFEERGLDAGTIVFRSVHPRYSYVKLNKQGFVLQASQKKPISQNATAGVFWFRQTGDFIDAAKACVRKTAHVDGKFYVAPTFNELLLKHKAIGIYEIDTCKYRPLKTERQLSNFEHG